MIYRKIKKENTLKSKEVLREGVLNTLDDIAVYSQNILSIYFEMEEVEFYNLVEDFISFIGLYAPFYFAIPLMKFDKEHRRASSYLSQSGDNLESAIFTAYTLNQQESEGEIVTKLFKNTRPLINTFVSTVAQMDEQQNFILKNGQKCYMAQNINLGQLFILNILTVSYGWDSPEVADFLSIQEIELEDTEKPIYHNNLLDSFVEKQLPLYPQKNIENVMDSIFGEEAYKGAIIIPPMDKIMDFDTLKIIEFNKNLKYDVKAIKVNKFVNIDLTKAVNERFAIETGEINDY